MVLGVSAPNPVQMISRVSSASFPRRLFMASLLLMPSLRPSEVMLLVYYSGWTEQLRYANIKAALQRQGMPVGDLDMMIAGHARSLGFTVVTNNRKHFDRIEGLTVEDWVER